MVDPSGAPVALAPGSSVTHVPLSLGAMGPRPRPPAVAGAQTEGSGERTAAACQTSFGAKRRRKQESLSANLRRTQARLMKQLIVGVSKRLQHSGVLSGGAKRRRMRTPKGLTRSARSTPEEVVSMMQQSGAEGVGPSAEEQPSAVPGADVTSPDLGQSSATLASESV